MKMGKYETRRLLATGGMAEVFLATAEGPGGFEKTLVLKRILPQLAEDPHFIQMFLAEAKLAAQLNHPHIVQIFDFGEFEGTYFLAMEHVDGVSLKELAARYFQARRTLLPLGPCVKILSLVCEGLAYAHGLTAPRTGQPLKIVHRDLSPDNVLISHSGGVKVADFGIARSEGVSNRTQVGFIKGKIAYMPPEQILGRPLDLRADIYALGVVLYQLVTGHLPYEEKNEYRLAREIVHEPPLPLSRWRTDLPVQLQRLIERAMAKDPNQRHASCQELQADLEHFLISQAQTVGAPQIAALVTEALGAPPDAGSSGDGESETPAHTRIFGGSPVEDEASREAAGPEDLDIAVQAYEEFGAAQRQRLLEEAAEAPENRRQNLVEVLRRARDFRAAAKLLEGGRSDAEAAALYEQAGDLGAAAEAWLRSGNMTRAAAVFERCGRLELALDLYQKLGARQAMAHCLMRMKRPLEAAALYRELNNVHAEVEALRGVPPGDPQYRQAVLRLCELMEQYGHTQRALALATGALQASEESWRDADLRALVLRLLRLLGRQAEADRLQARMDEGTPWVRDTPAPLTASEGYAYFKSIPIFGELLLEDMRDLYRMARQVSFQPGETLVEKGAQGVGLLVLLEGTVDVFIGPEADARLLNTLGPGAHLGEISLVRDAPASAHVRARTAVRALSISREDFQHYLSTHDAAALRIYRLFTISLAERVRALST
jgi:tetratricopeptide (TPR) repeat protein